MGNIVYKKAPVVIKHVKEQKVQGAKKSFDKKRLFPIVLVTIGSMLIANVSWPIISYQLSTSPQLSATTMLSPLSEEHTLRYTPTSVSEVVVPKVSAQQESATRLKEGPEIVSEELDYTNLSNWFSTPQLSQVEDGTTTEKMTYIMDIPAIKLSNLKVIVGETDLSKGLIQYPGTANPGELGDPVIFGHSTNPLFYNPAETNPKRYMSIFTKLMDLKKDDKIYITYDGVKYIYRVIDKLEVKPDDTYILQQRHDTRELKLITCTPVGTYLKRGVILAQLDDVQ